MIATRPLLIVALSIIAPLAPAQELVTLATRPDATQSYLLVAPKEAPQAAAILFAGSAGNVGLRMQGDQIELRSSNFLVRSRTLFSTRGVAAAVIDAPSDHSSGMSDDFRTGGQHVLDIRGVVSDLGKRYPGIPVFLVGTSRGTLSAAYAARALGKEVAGTVLTAAVFTPSGKRPGPVLSGFNFGALAAPLLIVHHREDACRLTPYNEARRLADKYPLISVSGGKPPESDPCEALTPHGFLGKEEETVEAIVNWMLKKPYRSEIN